LVVGYQRVAGVVQIKIEPLLASLRGDGRYAAMLRTMQLVRGSARGGSAQLFFTTSLCALS
jgi:hypothetical protein